MCANTFMVIHSEAQLLVLVLLTLFLCSSSCSPHGRYNQETPALKMPAQMSTQRRAPETTVGAMLPGQTVCAFCPFQNRKAGSFCTYVLAHICFCSNLNSPNSHFDSFGITSKATSQTSPSQVSASLWKGSHAAHVTV